MPVYSYFRLDSYRFCLQFKPPDRGIAFRGFMCRQNDVKKHSGKLSMLADCWMLLLVSVAHLQRMRFQRCVFCFYKAHLCKQMYLLANAKALLPGSPLCCWICPGETDIFEMCMLLILPNSSVAQVRSTPLWPRRVPSRFLLLWHIHCVGSKLIEWVFKTSCKFVFGKNLTGTSSVKDMVYVFLVWVPFDSIWYRARGPKVPYGPIWEIECRYGNADGTQIRRFLNKATSH